MGIKNRIGHLREALLAGFLLSGGMEGKIAKVDEESAKTKIELSPKPERLDLNVDLSKSSLGLTLIDQTVMNDPSKLGEAKAKLKKLGEEALNNLLHNKFESRTPDGKHDANAERRNLEQAIFDYAANPVFQDAKQILEELKSRGELTYPPELILALCVVESDLNVTEVSGVGALGVMQLMRNNPRRQALTKEQMFDLRTNLVEGVAELEKHIGENDNDVYFGLAAYNAGQAGLNRMIKATGAKKDMFSFFSAAHAKYGTVFYPLQISYFEEQFKKLRHPERFTPPSQPRAHKHYRKR